MAEEGKDAGQASATSVLEWVVAGIGAAIIASATAYMLWYGLTHPYAPPALRVETTAIEPAPEGFLVVLKIRNEGGSTAASVHVGGELVDNGQVIEQSETVLDYVPENSESVAFLQFARDPQAFSLRLRIKGMTEP